MRTFVEFMAEEHREMLSKVLSDLRVLQLNMRYDINAENNHHLSRIIAKLDIIINSE